MPAQLVSLADGPSILLDKPILLVGRHPECDIQIDSRKISRRHCCIAQVEDYLVVRDLGSTNGIRINSVRVLEGRLKAGDELTIGGNRYRVTWDMLPDSVLRVDLAKQRMEAELPVAEVVSDQDDLLEAADEPIPLAEPIAPAAPAAPQRSSFPAAGMAESKKRDLKNSHPSREKKSRAHIIPDEINLAPPSDLDVRTPHPS